MLTYYIVFVGRKTGVCASWFECRQRVFFYKGGLYKYYKTHDEAIRAWVLYPPRWERIEELQHRPCSLQNMDMMTTTRTGEILHLHYLNVSLLDCT